MNKSKIVLIVLSVFLLSSTPAQANTVSKDNGKTNGLKIVVTSLEITDKKLNITYEIKNESVKDVWIHTGGHQPSSNTFGMGAGLYMSADEFTLTIRSRLNTSKLKFGMGPGYQRLVRLRPGQSQIESVFIKMPVYLWRKSEQIGQKKQDIKHAQRLAIELGYYPGDFQDNILIKLEEKEKNRSLDPAGFISPHFFSIRNESLISRDEELLVHDGFRDDLADEKQYFLTKVIDDVNIPYKYGEKPYYPPRVSAPDLTSCSKVEITYQLSLLDYFFPFDFQQKLLSSEELQYLQSENTFVFEDAEDLKALSNDISKASIGVGGVVVRYRGHVNVVCHYENKPTISFPICNDNIILIEREQLVNLEGFPSLRNLTPRIQAIDLRMRCAANLKNQWYRFRLYHYHEAVRQKNQSIRNQVIYPAPTQWCDDTLRPFPISIGTGKWEKPHICPSAGEGKNHYAMNPNCEPNSPGDMVLLFETKAGWNQHGGPELFTFDNHAPKGGCVLLNDGTVKFIRTKEELNALKWK